MSKAKANVKQAPTNKNSEAMADKLKTEGRKDSASSVSATPIDAHAEAGPSHAPAQQGTFEPQIPYDDAPPSYEDAIASNMPSVDARRPEYAPPPAGEDDVLRSDEKKPSMFSRRDS